MNKEIDLTEARKYITKLVIPAGEILQQYYTFGRFTSQSKGGVDFLTQADEEVDEFLRERISSRFPESTLLTEETAPKDYSSLEQVENLWVIDPLDGTVNFSRDNPNFGISIGLVDRGIPKMGVTYLPITKDLFRVQTDEEFAFLNDKPIKVSSTGELRETVMACDWAWDLEKRLKVVNWLGNLAKHVRQIKMMGSAVADLASLANGKIDAYLHSGLKPWDTAATALLIEKAGGKITTPSGGKWNVFQPEILASNGILHDEIIKLINN